ncbi:glycosidase [Lacipirellula sp.]|uniref:glycoside hydrolase family 130 protein n=1 Tax=Lacipirellula sp. TaxID=2691419 RepID=UPI003D118617
MTIPSRILTRLLVKPADLSSQFEGFEVIGTFNPAAIEYDGGVALLIRVVEQPLQKKSGFIALPYWDHLQGAISIDWQPLSNVEMVDRRIVRLKSNGCIRLTFISYLLPAFSQDGLTITRFGEERMLPATKYETFGVEDPRLAKLNDRYFFTYVAVSPFGISTALASTTNFESFERHGIIFCPENKDVILFPEKIGDEFVAFHRPNPNGRLSPPEMWLARSPDLIHWGSHERLMGSEAHWANVKVGGGTPPLHTSAGWLSLYHGHIKPIPESSGQHDIGEYAAAAMLQAIEDPARILGMSPQPVMRAEADFERYGYLPNIVFPTAMLSRGEFVDVYYGAADTSTGVARYRLSDLLDATAPYPPLKLA